MNYGGASLLSSSDLCFSLRKMPFGWSRFVVSLRVYDCRSVLCFVFCVFVAEKKAKTNKLNESDWF